jgi:tetratricopeptide (TPR) repeat protein
MEDLEFDFDPGGLAEGTEEFVPVFGEAAASGEIDLARELSLFADEIDFAVREDGAVSEPFNTDLMASFKKNELDNEDTESHYSLGLAYREMGLLDEASSEFQVAARSDQRRVSCHILQALCRKDGGDLDGAVELLRETMVDPAVTAYEQLSISYELASCLEELGEIDEAERLYADILLRDPGFSDTASRLADLRG